MTRSEKFYKTFHPRFLFALMLVPFMCVCPMILCSLTLGFPYPYLQNNVQLKEYTNIFNELYESVEGVDSKGTQYSKIFSVKQRRGTCTLFAAQAMITRDTQQEISSKFLKQFTEIATKYQSDEDLYKIIRNSEVKILPIDINEDFSNTDVTLDLRRDFRLSDKDIPINQIEEKNEDENKNEEIQTEEEPVNPAVPIEGEQPVEGEVETEEKPEPPKPEVMYLVYLINTKAFDSLDFRCN